MLKRTFKIQRTVKKGPLFIDTPEDLKDPKFQQVSDGPLSVQSPTAEDPPLSSNGLASLARTHGMEVLAASAANGTLRAFDPLSEEWRVLTWRRKTLKVVYDDWYPLFKSFIHPVTGERVFKGIMHDILELVALRMGIQLEFVENPSPGIWGTKVFFRQKCTVQ